MRKEEDFLGVVDVPKEAYYGSFTARAKRNFQISGTLVHIELIRALTLIKKCAALANIELNRLDKQTGNAIIKAAEEVVEGKFDDQFVLDAFQAGAGTPLHMNINEVLANRAEEILGGKKGQYTKVHPNNQVNMAQSSNNEVPSAIRIASIRLVALTLDEALLLQKSFEKKAAVYANAVKIGRTHLQDAVPTTYGHIFKAYARAVEKDIEIMRKSTDYLSELGVGGTAIGSGITAHPKFSEKVVAGLKKETRLELRTAKNGIEMTQNMNDFVTVSAALKRYALTLSRIANDMRLLASGPKGGIAEIILPDVEPGSSIMPGKVNPSIPEAVNMIAFQVIGNDHAIVLAAESGQLELNFATPLIAHNIFQSAEILSNGSRMFRLFCIDGLKIDETRAKENLEAGFGYATALNPYLGYTEVSLLVREALRKGKTLKQIITQKGIMTEKDFDQIVASATGPALVDDGIKRRTKRE